MATCGQLFVITLLTNAVSLPLNRNGTVKIVDGELKIIPNMIDCSDATSIACGYFNDTLNETGWGTLEIQTSTEQTASTSDSTRMFAAGLLEGWLTPFETYFLWTNVWAERGPEFEPYYADLLNWTDTQNQWIAQQIAIHKLIHSSLSSCLRTVHTALTFSSMQDPEYAYWQLMDLVRAQLDGLQQGYNTAAQQLNLPTLDSFSFSFLNSLEEFGDLLHVFDPDRLDVDWTALSDEEFMRTTLQQGSCSGLVKVTPTLDDIFLRTRRGPTTTA